MPRALESPHSPRSYPDCASLVAFARSPTDEFIYSLFGRRPHRCRKESAIQILELQCNGDNDIPFAVASHRCKRPTPIIDLAGAG